MDEDVLGPRQTIVGERYDSCSRCGRPISHSEAAIPHVPGEGPALVADVRGAPRPLEATLDAPPPVLCPTCAREVAAGEPLELDDAQDLDEPGAPGPDLSGA